jgi:hypothetical protein
LTDTRQFGLGLLERELEWLRVKAEQYIPPFTL